MSLKVLNDYPSEVKVKKTVEYPAGLSAADVEYRVGCIPALKGESLALFPS